MSSGRSTVYRVELMGRSLLDLEAIYMSIGAGNSAAVFAWYSGLEHLLFSLDRSPERDVRTAEDRSLRQLLYVSFSTATSHISID